MVLDNKRKQLIFRAWHRGTREMDLILGSFADTFVPQMSEAELEDFARFLEFADPQLYNWYTGQTPVPANLRDAMMERYLNYTPPVAK